MLRTALGSAIATFLEDPTIVEVMLNPDGRLWVDRLSEGLSDTGERLSPADGERIVRLVAHHVGAEVHPGAPRVSAELPETGERFEGLLPPVVSAPAFAIRKPAVAVFTLDDYVRAGIMSEAEAAALRTGVFARANILVAGGTGTGKTTLVNALLAEVAKTDDRIVLIEDTRELQCAAPNLVAMRTKDGVVSLSDLVRSSLRLRPDRIPIGEVRGAEALDLLKAWGTGHPGGVGTIHAGSALGALRKLHRQRIRPAGRRSRVPVLDADRDRRDHRRAVLGLGRRRGRTPAAHQEDPLYRLLRLHHRQLPPPRDDRLRELRRPRSQGQRRQPEPGRVHEAWQHRGHRPSGRQSLAPARQGDPRRAPPARRHAGRCRRSFRRDQRAQPRRACTGSERTHGGRRKVIDPTRIDPDHRFDRIGLYEQRELKIHDGETVFWRDKDQGRDIAKSTYATVLEARPEGVRVELADKRQLVLAPGDPMLRRLDLGYALNAHMAQGMTKAC